jgi:hypothetical protein
MTLLEKAERFWANLEDCDARSLAALGAEGCCAFALSGHAGQRLRAFPVALFNRDFDGKGTGRTASVLEGANIIFDVSCDGAAWRAGVAAARSRRQNSANPGTCDVK